MNTTSIIGPYLDDDAPLPRRPPPDLETTPTRDLIHQLAVRHVGFIAVLVRPANPDDNDPPCAIAMPGDPLNPDAVRDSLFLLDFARRRLRRRLRNLP